MKTWLNPSQIKSQKIVVPKHDFLEDPFTDYIGNQEEYIYLSDEHRKNFGTSETNAKIIFSKCVTELKNLGITINKIMIDMNQFHDGNTSSCIGNTIPFVFICSRGNYRILLEYYDDCDHAYGLFEIKHIYNTYNNTYQSLWYCIFDSVDTFVDGALQIFLDSTDIEEYTNKMFGFLEEKMIMFKDAGFEIETQQPDFLSRNKLFRLTRNGNKTVLLLASYPTKIKKTQLLNNLNKHVTYELYFSSEKNLSDLYKYKYQTNNYARWMDYNERESIGTFNDFKNVYFDPAYAKKVDLDDPNVLDIVNDYIEMIYRDRTQDLIIANIFNKYSTEVISYRTYSKINPELSGFIHRLTLVAGMYFYPFDIFVFDIHTDNTNMCAVKINHYVRSDSASPDLLVNHFEDEIFVSDLEKYLITTVQTIEKIIVKDANTKKFIAIVNF